MSDITRLQPGARMSKIVIHGDVIHLAGQVASNAPGAPVGEQTADILAQVDALLAEAGSSKERILSVTIYLADIATFAEMNAAWDAWVAPGNTPARATVEAKLAAPQFTVEIMVIAAR